MKQPASGIRSMELPLVGPLRPVPLPTTSEPSKPRPSLLSKVAPVARPDDERVLDFDIESVAAGFADPEWVPQKVTCVAWSWVGEDRVESRVCGPLGIFGVPELRARMLEPLLAAIGEADVLTGHNIARFDLPVLNAECVRLGLEPIKSVVVEDTMRLVRAKGLKKGQDVLANTLRVEGADKMHLDWQAWQDGYDEIGTNLRALRRPNENGVWATIRARAESDVRGHKKIREELLRRGVLQPKRRWIGKR